MSNWTHVAAVVRVGPTEPFCVLFGEMDFDRAFGLEFAGEGKHESGLYDIWKNKPELFMPSGSEGTLQKHVWTGPDYSRAKYTVSIFGDLRDHDDPDAIIEWFQKKCDKLDPVQAVITVENRKYGVRTWAYVQESHLEESECYEVRYVD